MMQPLNNDTEQALADGHDEVRQRPSGFPGAKKPRETGAWRYRVHCALTAVLAAFVIASMVAAAAYCSSDEWGMTLDLAKVAAPVSADAFIPRDICERPTPCSTFSDGWQTPNDYALCSAALSPPQIRSAEAALLEVGLDPKHFVLEHPCTHNRDAKGPAALPDGRIGLDVTGLVNVPSLSKNYFVYLTYIGLQALSASEPHKSIESHIETTYRAAMAHKPRFLQSSVAPTHRELALATAFQTACVTLGREPRVPQALQGFVCTHTDHPSTARVSAATAAAAPTTAAPAKPTTTSTAKPTTKATTKATSKPPSTTKAQSTSKV